MTGPLLATVGNLATGLCAALLLLCGALAVRGVYREHLRRMARVRGAQRRDGLPLHREHPGWWVPQTSRAPDESWVPQQRSTSPDEER